MNKKNILMTRENKNNKINYFNLRNKFKKLINIKNKKLLKGKKLTKLSNKKTMSSEFKIFKSNFAFILLKLLLYYNFLFH